MLKLMYITNKPEIARIAENAGVDRIFVDLEYIGKAIRQGGMDTVQSHHTQEDIVNIKRAIRQAQLLVRCNPIHDATSEYVSSEDEIDTVIENGAEIVMLPFFKTPAEVERFIRCVNGRTRTMLLVETPEAVSQIDRILNIKGIDEIYIGLNDLSLGYGKKFMFELLVDGTVEQLCFRFRQRQIPFGFGGIAAIGHGLLPAEKIIKEHYRLGSTCAILSRSFCDVERVDQLWDVKKIFDNGVREIRNLEKECMIHSNFFVENRHEVEKTINRILRT